jgi:hypothetical protein
VTEKPPRRPSVCGACRPKCAEAVSLPLQEIDKASMARYRGQHIFVLETDNYDSTQAAVRLKQVLHFESVTIVHTEAGGM